MNRIYNTLCLIVGVLLLGSCSKEDIPMTSTVELAGEWMVTVDIIDGDNVYEDPFELGQMLWLTYNTNADDGKEIWLDDCGNFWATKVKVPCNTSNRTFGSSSPLKNAYFYNQYNYLYDIEVTVKDGKVTPNGALTPSGMPADKIEFYISYEDDDDNYTYYCHGYRRTGFVADE